VRLRVLSGGHERRITLTLCEHPKAQAAQYLTHLMLDIALAKREGAYRGGNARLGRERVSTLADAIEVSRQFGK
jgi:hypothetical protein